jgi:hypothetical protein
MAARTPSMLTALTAPPLLHLHRRIGILHANPTMKMEKTECSEKAAYKIQTPEKLPRRKYTTFRTRQQFEINNTVMFDSYG